MPEFIRNHWAYLIGAVLLHLVFAAVFGLTLVNIWSKPLQPTLAIQAVVVDRSVLEGAARKQQREQEQERRQAEEQQVRERQETERKAQADAERQRKAEAERKRVADIERK